MEKEIETLKTKYDLSDESDEENQDPEEKVENESSLQDDNYENSESEVRHPLVDEDALVWDSEDKTVPRNWKVGKYKDGRKGKMFKCPVGFVFHNRVKALEFMIHGNYPENLLSLMKNNLSDEGWVHDRSCPVRWKTRRTVGDGGEVDYEYLSPGLEMISSMREMLEFLKSNDGFDLRIIKKLEDKMKSTCFLNIKARQKHPEVKNNEEEKTILDEEILPTGWTKKLIGQSKVYVSPEGNIVHTIQQVLSAVENSKKSTVMMHDEFKPVVAVTEKRKFEDFLAMNSKDMVVSSPKRKHKVDVFSVDRLKILEDMHAKSLYPDSDNIKYICSATGLGEKDVKSWFVKKAAEQSIGLLKPSSTLSSSTHLGSPKQRMSSPLPSFEHHAPSKISEQHTNALNEIFNFNPNPTSENFKQIAERLGIGRQIIINWFKKKRISASTLAERKSVAKDNSDERRSEVESPTDNDIISADQERSLQLVLAKTKTPTNKDYQALVRATGLSRLKIERWFNFHK